MSNQSICPAPIRLPESTGCDEICCPCCSAPLEFAFDYSDRIEEAKCPQCPFAWCEPAEQSCGQACEADVVECGCPF